MPSQKNMLGSVHNHDRINDGNSDGRTLTRFGTIRKFPSRNIHQISVYFRRRATVEAIRAEAGDTNNLARSRMINVFVSRHRRSVVLLNPIPIMLNVSVPPTESVPMLVTSCLTNGTNWVGGEPGEGMVEDTREDARFAASASKQTQTRGFEVPHVLRDFARARAHNSPLSHFPQRAKSFSRKKDAEIARVCKTRALFQSRRRRLKRAGILFRSCKSIRVILGFLTSKWMSRFIIEREDQRKKDIYILYECLMNILKVHNYS